MHSVALRCIIYYIILYCIILYFSRYLEIDTWTTIHTAFQLLHNRGKFRPQIRIVLNFRYKHLSHPLLLISSPTLNLRRIVDKHVKGDNVSPCSTQPHSHPCLLEHKTTYRYPTAYNFPRLALLYLLVVNKREVNSGGGGLKITTHRPLCSQQPLKSPVQESHKTQYKVPATCSLQTRHKGHARFSISIPLRQCCQTKASILKCDKIDNLFFYVFCTVH